MSTERSAAARDYDEAHAIHYGERDLLTALRAYEQVIELHPSDSEAEYSRAQIRNIVNSVVPPEEVLTAQIGLLLRHLDPTGDGMTSVGHA